MSHDNNLRTEEIGDSGGCPIMLELSDIAVHMCWRISWHAKLFVNTTKFIGLLAIIFSRFAISTLTLERLESPVLQRLCGI